MPVSRHRAANNGALHSIINAAGFWKALWKSEPVGADEVEQAGTCTWLHALQQLHAIDGLRHAEPCSTVHDAHAAMQQASLDRLSAAGSSCPDCDFCFMRLSQRRSFKVDPSLLEWICFSRTPQAITITCVPVIPPLHLLNGRPPSSYLPMCGHLSLIPSQQDEL
jgi:hypothetical protein